MKFPYQKLPHGKQDIPKPIIDVFMEGPLGPFYCKCLVDSGADSSIFPAKGIGEDLLCLNIRSGERKDMHGISGKPLEGYEHEIDIGVGGRKYKLKAVFAYGFDQGMGLLGRNGFFILFKRVCFEEGKKQIKITLFNP